MYRLIYQTTAHDGPARCLSAGPEPGTLLSGGQDAALRVWSLPSHAALADAAMSGSSGSSSGSSSGMSSVPQMHMLGHPLQHSHWVVSCCSLPPTILPSLLPFGGIVTGCQDGKIRIYRSSEGEGAEEEVFALEGHRKGVISLSLTSMGHLLSGSWDGSARLWDLSSLASLSPGTSCCVAEFPGHENGVHAIEVPSSSSSSSSSSGSVTYTIATVSTGEQVNNKPANFRLRLWDAASGQPLTASPISDHAGPIRSVFALPHMLGFGTSSNDGTIALRDASGNPVAIVMHDPQDDGFPPFVLDAVAIGSEGDFVSCSEDGAVNVWSGASRRQSIPHPCSVWAVAALPGGNFATAGHDGIVRVFSCDALCASLPSVEALHAAFEAEAAEVADRKRRGAGPSAEDLAKAPKWELRGTNPGRSEGQVGVFNKDGKLIAAQWLAASGAWIEVGEVVGGAGDGGLVHGVKYDHIMPVELETANGLVELKLGYNNGENPFQSAQRFIEQNNLPQTYLGQIADFIMNRSGQQAAPTFDLAAGNGSNSSAPAGNASAHQPSFTPASGVLGTAASTATTTASTPVSSHFPSTTYSYYSDVAPAAKVLAKIREFNADSGVLSEVDVSNLSSLLGALEGTSYYHSSEVTREQLLSLLRMAVWGSPDAANADSVRRRFFICLDICRMALMHPGAAEVLGAAIGGPSRGGMDMDIASGLRNVCNYGLNHLMHGVLPEATNTTDATALSYVRMLCNFFKTPALVKMLVHNADGSGSDSSSNSSILDQILSLPHARMVHLCRRGKTTRGALSSLVYNAMVYLSSEHRTARPTVVVVDDKQMHTLARCVSVAACILSTESEAAEPATKCVLALGMAAALLVTHTASSSSSARARDVVSQILGAVRSITAAQRSLIGVDVCDLYTHDIERMLA